VLPNLGNDSNILRVKQARPSAISAAEHRDHGLRQGQSRVAVSRRYDRGRWIVVGARGGCDDDKIACGRYRVTKAGAVLHQVDRKR
jgi:hypothetical protein